VASNALSQAIRLRVYKHRVSRTLDAGVLPLVLRYRQINACDTKLPIAYRTETIVRSTALGYLTPEEYQHACESTQVSFRMAEWSVVEAMKHINHFVKAGRDVQWISVRCPSSMVERVDFYQWMKRLIKENHFRYPSKLCLEFDTSLLSKKTEPARLAILDMKLLGVKTLLSGCGDADCPMARIVQIPVDMVMLAPSVTKWTGSRNKPQVVPTLIPYLRSMRTEVYAAGVLNDEQIRLLNRSECIGYTTSSLYEGKSPTERNLGVRKALAQKDTEDDFTL
jgi:EAL domain-containing protein (putative c-di-GMP-specific phosphodiesterase class I)